MTGVQTCALPIYLRANRTATEVHLWNSLKNLPDPRFRQQVAFGPYVLDFYAPRYRLCIEVDGPFHDVDKDRERDAWLVEKGVYTLRFKADDLSVDAVLAEIDRTCAWLNPKFRLKNDQ